MYHPDTYAAVRDRTRVEWHPPEFPAEHIAGTPLAVAAAARGPAKQEIDYAPADRPLDPLTDTFTVICHASPDAGFPVLQAFLGRTQQKLSVGIYDFTSAHVLASVEASAQQPFVTIEGDLKTAAWWGLADFHPFETEVRGIPVNQIRKNWCKATEFRKDLIPKEILFEEGVDEMEASKLSFALEGHFDGSANTQTALVGVYQECSGQKGRFIMIL